MISISMCMRVQCTPGPVFNFSLQEYDWPIYIIISIGSISAHNAFPVGFVSQILREAVFPNVYIE